MPNNLKKYTLDRLLDIKRAETPSEEFWDGFQSEFRQRQLQSLIEKESLWIRIPRSILAHPGIFASVSAVTLALFILMVNFQENKPINNEYFETAPMLPSVELVAEYRPTEPILVSQKIEENPEAAFVSSLPAPSFVMDMIPNEEVDSLNYTKEFPISTIPADNRAISALVSYTIANDGPSFGMASPQAIGF